MRRLLPVFALCALTAFAACNASAPPLEELGASGSTGAGSTNGGGAAGADGAGSSGASGAGIGVGGSGVTDDDACASADYPAGRVPASLLFVFDRSGSMTESASGGMSGPSKWDVATEAVSTALDGIDLEVDLGFMVFPAGKFNEGQLAGCILSSSPQCTAIVEDSGCKDIDPTPSVLMSPIAESRPKIQSLLASINPTGGTPTRWALKYAWAYMQGLETAGERYVVLVTDGQPQTYGSNPIQPNAAKECGTLGQLAADTTAATTGTPPVKTFVIGSPGDTDSTVLSGLALNGGTALPGCNSSNYTVKDCHYQLSKGDFGDGLVNALKEIASKASNGCTFAVPAGANSNPELVNVQAEGPVGKVGILKDSSHQNGWDYTDDSKSKVEVHGPLCDQLRNGELLTVKVLTGCKTKEAN